jgi:hypothetical protein
MSPGARAWLITTIAVTAGAAAGAIALAPAGSGPAPAGLAFLLFTGSSVHVASTGWFYTVAPFRAQVRRQKGRYLWWPLALIAGAGATALVVPRQLEYWLLLPYFGWQFYHYQKQNLGVAALAASVCRASGLTRAERLALIAAGLAGTGALLARPSLLQLPLRPVLPAMPVIAAVAFAGSVVAGAVFLARRPRQRRPAGLTAAYLTSLLFSTPVFVFRSPYAAVAGLTIAHGLQYLVLMGMVAGGGVTGRKRLYQLAILCDIALLGGAALSVASDQAVARDGGRILYGVFLGTVMAHFVIDAGVWRMRDAFPRAFLSARLPALVPPAGKSS